MDVLALIKEIQNTGAYVHVSWKPQGTILCVIAKVVKDKDKEWHELQTQHESLDLADAVTVAHATMQAELGALKL